MKKTLISSAAMVTGLALGCFQWVDAQAPADATAPSAESRDKASPAAPQNPEAVVPHEDTVPVSALPAPDATPPERLGIAEIVVTARRTAEALQDVPVAIAAMNSEDLDREHIGSPQDLQGRVPSLVIGSGSQLRNTETPTIRGQGAQFGSSPGVIIYLSEVPLPSDPVANNQGGPGKFFDLSNVQVLKGSQGTLFGRNTTGGALLLEPHKPDNNLSASLKAEGSSYAGQGYEAVVNVPVIDDTLLARFGGTYFDRDGFTHDITTGKDYDSKHYWTSRLGITWRPSERIDNYLLGYFSDSRDHGSGTVINAINRADLNTAIASEVGLGIIGAIPLGPEGQQAGPGCALLDIFGHSLNCGQNILDEQNARGPRHVELSADPDDILKTGGAIDHLNFNLADELTLRNIASFSRFLHHYRWDQDGSRVAFNDFTSADNVQQGDVTTFTEELQLQGKALSDKLTFTAGGYYEHTKATGAQIALAVFVQNLIQSYVQTKESYAPYAQATYNLGGLFEALSGLNLTLGARYTIDKTKGDVIFQQKVLNLVALVDNHFSPEQSSSALTYTAGLDYKIGANLLYGKISRGYKSGGVTVVSVNPDHYTFKPEEVLNYEIGLKSDFETLDIPVRVNSAIYYTDYTDLQKDGADSYVPPNKPAAMPEFGDAVFNAGKAHVYGFETDVTALPFRGATFVATYGYTQAAYDKFSLLVGGITPQLDCSGQRITRGNVAELSCAPFQATPKQQFSLSARYLLPVSASIGDIEGFLTYAWTDRLYSAPVTLPAAEPGAWLPSFGLLNASLSWRGIFGSALEAQLFGTNLADKLYRISNSNQWTFTYQQASIYSEPRIIGGNLTYRWGS